jgi:carbamate kinase
MGQIGYILAQALSSAGMTTAPIICQVVVDPQHDAFRDPSKFIGPVYGAKEATALSQSLGWVMKPDGEYFRRVVPSPPPVEYVYFMFVFSMMVLFDVPFSYHPARR